MICRIARAQISIPLTVPIRHHRRFLFHFPKHGKLLGAHHVASHVFANAALRSFLQRTNIHQSFCGYARLGENMKTPSIIDRRPAAKIPMTLRSRLGASNAT